MPGRAPGIVTAVTSLNQHHGSRQITAPGTFGDDRVEPFSAVTTDVGQQPRRLGPERSSKYGSGVCLLLTSGADTNRSGSWLTISVKWRCPLRVSDLVDPYPDEAHQQVIGVAAVGDGPEALCRLPDSRNRLGHGTKKPRRQ